MFPEAADPWFPGWYHLAWFGVAIPALVIRGWWKLKRKERPLPKRMTHLRFTAFMLVLLTCLSLVVARAQWIELFPIGTDHLARGVLAGLAMYFAAVAFMRPRWRRAVERRAPIVHLFMPDNAAERAWWIAVSVLAGVGEEITWRGVQTALLFGLTGSYWMAATASAISFGVAHFIQGWRSTAIIVVFALGFQAVVWLSGSLYVAMIVHVAYDITAGLTYGRLERALGYTLDESSTQPTSAAPSATTRLR